MNIGESKRVLHRCALKFNMVDREQGKTRNVCKWWVEWIKMIRWNPITPSQWLERNGGAWFSLISLIDQSTTTLCLSKNHHTIGKGTIFVHRGSVGGPLMSTYLLHMLKDISPTFSQLMRRAKEKERRCYDAGKIKKTSYFCPDCDVGLCTAPCPGCTISHWL